MHREVSVRKETRSKRVGREGRGGVGKRERLDAVFGAAENFIVVIPRRR
jgi:hypothetical protein